jgi:hypothetical protein
MMRQFMGIGVQEQAGSIQREMFCHDPLIKLKASGVAGNGMEERERVWHYLQQSSEIRRML